MNETLLTESRIPETVADLDYFLSAINTPVWHWGIRVVLLVGFVIAVGVYLRYRKALIVKRKPVSGRILARRQ